MIRWLLALSALLLGACAPFHLPLAPESRARIAEVDVRVVVAQESFMFSAQPPGVSAAAGGGLIAALIDASIQQSRQKAMSAEVQATVGPLLDFDYRAEAGQALKGIGSNGAFPFKIRSAQVLAGMPMKKDHEATIAATRGGSAYMVLMVYYALEPGLGAFTTRTTATLWQDGNPEPSYRASAIFQAPLVAGSRAEVLQRLTAQDGALLRSTMQASMSETLRMVVLDIVSPPEPAKGATSKAKPLRLNFNGTWVPLDGVEIEAKPERTILRDQAGVLYSLAERTP
ncbi:hypothetical protein [Variovorax ginsengisoli]|uniref:Lipoprotein n=1 Tax=Variovorax ginsengisoli TaxID=363844 RepID=A0ABT9SBF4_9BURK|nr:hypothetical protein [Variovorax ginsengisoli]MDP9901096.1 hypothetical protein [Variovorax ginsengisoli]